MPIRGVVFDVGGPLNTEVTREWLIDEHIRAAFAAAGHPVDDAAFTEAVRWAVDSFAPDAYQAIIWRLAARDVDLSERVYRALAACAHERQISKVREGIPELLDHLHTRGLHLGPAANQQHSGIIGADHLTPGQAARVMAAIVPLPLVDIVEVHRVALYCCGCGTVLTAGIGVGARDIY